MPERSTRTETLRVGTPVIVGSFTLLVVERIVRHTYCSNTRVWFSVAKTPYALVLRDAAGIRAVGPDALAVPVDELRAQVPSFDVALATL